LRINGKYHNLSLICVCAPREDSDNTVKEIQDHTPKHDVIVLLGDNAKIELEDAYSSVTGKYSLHKESNSNGELICEYAAAQNFKHKKDTKEHGLHQRETHVIRQIMCQ
jgi:hypothetical protein